MLAEIHLATVYRGIRNKTPPLKQKSANFDFWVFIFAKILANLGKMSYFCNFFGAHFLTVFPLVTQLKTQFFSGALRAPFPQVLVPVGAFPLYKSLTEAQFPQIFAPSARKFLFLPKIWPIRFPSSYFCQKFSKCSEASFYFGGGVNSNTPVLPGC